MADRASFINYVYWFGYSILIIAQFYFLIWLFRGCEYFSTRIANRVRGDKRSKGRAAAAPRAARKDGLGWWT